MALEDLPLDQNRILVQYHLENDEPQGAVFVAPVRCKLEEVHVASSVAVTGTEAFSFVNATAGVIGSTDVAGLGAFESRLIGIADMVAYDDAANVLEEGQSLVISYSGATSTNDWFLGLVFRREF